MVQAEYSIRRATIDDAEALALVHEATWRETYVGLLSEQMLDALTADARTAAWRRILSGATDDHLSTVYVAERPGAQSSPSAPAASSATRNSPPGLRRRIHLGLRPEDGPRDRGSAPL